VQDTGSWLLAAGQKEEPYRSRLPAASRQWPVALRRARMIPKPAIEFTESNASDLQHPPPRILRDAAGMHHRRRRLHLPHQPDSTTRYLRSPRPARCPDE